MKTVMLTSNLPVAAGCPRTAASRTCAKSGNWHYGRHAAQAALLLWQEGRLCFHREHLRQLRREQSGLRQALLAFAEAFLRVRGFKLP